MAADGLTTSVVFHIFALIGKDAAHSYAVSHKKLEFPVSFRSHIMTECVTSSFQEVEHRFKGLVKPF